MVKYNVITDRNILIARFWCHNCWCLHFNYCFIVEVLLVCIIMMKKRNQTIFHYCMIQWALSTVDDSTSLVFSNKRQELIIYFYNWITVFDKTNIPIKTNIPNKMNMPRRSALLVFNFTRPLNFLAMFPYYQVISPPLLNGLTNRFRYKENMSLAKNKQIIISIVFCCYGLNNSTHISSTTLLYYNCNIL